MNLQIHRAVTVSSEQNHLKLKSYPLISHLGYSWTVHDFSQEAAFNETSLFLFHPTPSLP